MSENGCKVCDYFIEGCMHPKKEQECIVCGSSDLKELENEGQLYCQECFAILGCPGDLVGESLTEEELSSEIEKVVIKEIKPFDNSYRYYYPSRNFCPYCGCKKFSATVYSKEWIKYYCTKCSNFVSAKDSGHVWHAIFKFKPAFQFMSGPYL